MNTVLPPTAPAPMALHCPKCGAEMATYERSGIVVDQCRECRGIFLDRGELERLVDIESGTGWTGPRMAVPPPVDPRTLDARYLDPRPADPRYGYQTQADPRHATASRDGRSTAYSPD